MAIGKAARSAIWSGLAVTQVGFAGVTRTMARDLVVTGDRAAVALGTKSYPTPQVHEGNAVHRQLHVVIDVVRVR